MGGRGLKVGILLFFFIESFSFSFSFSFSSFFLGFI